MIENLHVFITIYFTINGITAGTYWGKNVDWVEDNFGLLKLGLISKLLLLFGAPILILSLLFMLLGFLWSKINGYLPIKFLYHFYLTNKFDVGVYEEDSLERVNYLAQLKKENNPNIFGKIFIYCVGLINKRHNYVYKPTKNE